MNETPKLRMRWTQFSLCALLLSINCVAGAQQFNADNQWVAPHGVGTVAATTGEEYSTLVLVGAFVPEWEFNLGMTHYDSSSDGLTESHDTGTLYVKHRFFEDEQETGGLAIMAGTGIYPGHLEAGEVTDTFESWWANLVYTIPFNDGQITWDLLPGFLLNLDQNDTDTRAWGMTYSSRVAIYDVIPQSAIVAEVFGTTGEAHADPQYRFGVRWESPRLIIAATFSEAINHSGGAGFEIGFVYLTEPRFCFGGCRR